MKNINLIQNRFCGWVLKHCHTIVVLFLFPFSISCYADGIKYTTEFIESFWLCETEINENTLVEGSISDYVQIGCSIGKDDGGSALIFYFFANLSSTDKLKKILKIVGERTIENSEVTVKLSNGEIFTVNYKTTISATTLNDSKLFHKISLIFAMHSTNSNRKTIKSESSRQSYFASRLKLYNIESVSFLGETFYLSFKTVSTLKSMFNTLASKSGYSNAFNYNPSPSSSNNNSSSTQVGASTYSRENSGSANSSINRELPYRFESPDVMKLKVDDATKGDYRGLLDYKGGLVGVIVKTKTGKRPEDAGLPDYELEVKPMNGETADWVKVVNPHPNLLAIEFDPNYKSSSRAVRLYFKVNGKVYGSIFVIQLAEGSQINW